MARAAYCFDLDGTLTEAEILPLIAREVGLAEEIGLLTAATMAGVLPFEPSFRLRCRLLADVPIDVVRGVVATVPIDPRLEAFVAERADRCFVVSGNLDVWIAPLVERLGCGAFTSTARAEGDRLLGVDRVLDKAEAVRVVRERFATVVAVGDGANDVPMFEQADVRVAYGAVHEPADALRRLADYWVVSGEGLCTLLTSLS